jgi:uncharacterized protein (DUF4415 family)
MSKRYERALAPEEIAKLSDSEIDFSDIPELDETFWNRARVVYPEGSKTQLTVRFDSDLVDWFKADGKGYQTRMNAVLRAYVEAMRKRR